MEKTTIAELESRIYGLQIKVLKTHKDGRGFFREIIRASDPFFQEAGTAHQGFMQWSHSKMQKDVVKAWHYHHKQYDWWYCGVGKMLTALYDNRPESPTYQTKIEFFMGDSEEYGSEVNEVCVKIPPGVLHGLRVHSDFAHLFYITSETYNPQEEGRFKFDSAFVPHNWGPGAITVENDRRDFVPVAERKLVK